jgi:hypothetical protein
MLKKKEYDDQEKEREAKELEAAARNPAVLRRVDKLRVDAPSSLAMQKTTVFGASKLAEQGSMTVGSSGSERAVDELPTPTGKVATIDVSRAEGDPQAEGSGGKSFWMVRPEESGKLLDAHPIKGVGGLGQPEKTKLGKWHELERARTEVVDKAIGESDTIQRELGSARTRKSSRRALQSRVLKMAA